MSGISAFNIYSNTMITIEVDPATNQPTDVQPESLRDVAILLCKVKYGSISEDEKTVNKNLLSGWVFPKNDGGE